MTPDIETLLEKEDTYISGDYRQNKPLGDTNTVQGETKYSNISFVECSEDLLPDLTTTRYNSLKFANSDTTDSSGATVNGVRAVNSSGSATAARAANFRPIIFWTEKACCRGDHSKGVQTIMYLDPQRMNQPAIQVNFFTGAVRLYEDDVYLLLLK